MEKLSNKERALHLGLVGVFMLISYKFRMDLSFFDVEPLISILQNVSAMIFTIMGIWIAYIYPNAVLRVVQPSGVSPFLDKENLKRVRLLVGVVIITAFILCGLVIGLAVKTFIVKTVGYASHKGFFQAVGLWGLLILVYAQLYCIWIVIASNINFVIDLKNLYSSREGDEKLEPSGRDSL